MKKGRGRGKGNNAEDTKSPAKGRRKQGDPGSPEDLVESKKPASNNKSQQPPTKKQQPAKPQSKEEPAQPAQPAQPKGKAGKTKTKVSAAERANQPIDAEAAMKNAIHEATKLESRAQFTIKLDNFSLEFKGNFLLQDASLTLAFGHRYGLVGPNGSGKSTLLRAIGRREIDVQDKDKAIPKDVKVLYVEQEVDGHPTKNALESVVEADTERIELFAEKERLEKQKEEDENEDRYDEECQDKLIEVNKRLQAIGAYTAQHRAKTILTGLQFTDRMQSCPTQELSGGWRMRIALARSLFCRPHLLLLDEPSNHLDLYACFWLQGFLKKWKKTLLVVSHDIDMLNEICTDIVQLDPHDLKLHQYRGDYDHFVYASAERAREYKKKYDKISKAKIRLQTLKETADKGGSKKGKGGRGVKKDKSQNNMGRTGGQGQHKKAVIRKEQELARQEQELNLKPPPKEYKVNFDFPDPDPLPHPVLQVREVSFTYPGIEKSIFKNLELGVDMESRVAVVGRNGVGKSTLMKIILGELKPTEGEVVHSPKLRVAHFAQHFVDELPMDSSPTKYIGDTYKTEEKEARRFLGRFGLSGKVQINPINTLSGGQKSRVMFTSLALQYPHILFLDEPTNHLDIQSIEALAEGLQEFAGGVFLITHNQRLIGSSCNRIWIVEGDGSVNEWKGDFKEYQKYIQSTMVYEDDDEEV